MGRLCSDHAPTPVTAVLAKLRQARRQKSDAADGEAMGLADMGPTRTAGAQAAIAARLISVHSEGTHALDSVLDVTKVISKSSAAVIHATLQMATGHGTGSHGPHKDCRRTGCNRCTPRQRPLTG